MGDVALPTPLGKAAQQAWDFAQVQVRHLITTYPDYFPLYTSGGRWHQGQEAWTNWCEGFLGGMLWVFAIRTGDPWWRERAEHYSRLIEPRKSDRSVHDLGFLFWPTWKCWYDLTGDERIQRVVIEAGQTLALRFNERGRYLRSFRSQFALVSSLLDCVRRRSRGRPAEGRASS